jgi:pSer/pThr/pTyr-binding forkhead associated (FHA) protein
MVSTGIVILVLRILLAASLYAFLGWALWTIWQDLRAHGRTISAPDVPPISLIPIEPDESPPVRLNLPEIHIGRGEGNDYPIHDETVSARHARLSFHHNQWWVEDLKSTNGTFLNDERVSVPTVIVSGDELRCGQISLNVRIDEKGR